MMLAGDSVACDPLSEAHFPQAPITNETVMTSHPQRGPTHRQGFRAIAATGIAATLIAFTAPVASAQILFTGITTYGFDGQPLGTTATLGGLTITQDGFSVTTNTYGYAGIGGLGSNLGLVSLTDAPFMYGGHTFQMNVEFLSPTTSAQNFFAVISGSVSNLNGGAHIRFNPTIITGIPFMDGSGSGTFEFSINNVSINAGQSNAQITGDITVVPEPASVALLAFGLAAVAIGIRRRTTVAYS